MQHTKKIVGAILLLSASAVTLAVAHAQVPPMPELPMPSQAPVSAPQPQVPQNPSMPPLPEPALPSAAPVAPSALPAPVASVPPAAMPPIPAAGAANPQVSPNLPSLPQPSAQPAQPTPAANLPSGAPTSDASNSTQANQFSFGNSDLSLLFLPPQMERMKNAIRAYEISNRDAKPTTFVAPEPIVTQVIERIDEPTAYPVFYLASVAYDSPSDWSVWISGHKITSTKNETDLSVLSASNDSVTFLWVPDFAEAIKRRKSDDLFSPIDAVKHKLAATQNFKLNESSGAITFTLRPNQSFSVGYLSVFEGFVESPQMQPVISSSPMGGDFLSSMGAPSPGQPPR